MSERLKEGLKVAKSIVVPTEEQKRLKQQVANAADTLRLDILTNSRATDETVGEVLDTINGNEKKMKKKINRGINPFTEKEI
jgi:hypothetical protein